MDEFQFIQSIQPSYYRQSTLIKGVSDDAAVFRPTDKDVVTAVDTMVEGVHFSRKTMEPYHIGYRVLAANLSDLAAMASTPAFYLVSIVIPEGWSEQELKELYSGMQHLASLYKMDLIGGDTVSGSELSISVTVIGYVEKDRARYRSQAEPGDIVFATGTLGDSRAGLEILLNGSSGEASEKFFIERHRTPDPRVFFALELEEIPRIALNDISDGVANEANEIVEASHVDLHLDMDKLPFTSSIKDLFPDTYKDWILSGGEDFELVGTVEEALWPKVQQAAKKTGVKVSQIGSVQAMKKKDPIVYLHEGGKKNVLMKSGYTHLKTKGE
ncbi:thiamine-monophosphate kinase [Halobacillus halophilus]|uniref:Thiamine-monophosphate kinase n=1 Tax=Halobacillus halophilus (strain ATCC 35676 / DSM 2266 / JCM 20832 / KCTC 3685 / LMG 17431 / NBRC 102448 / NCIMB 2269) TaxID=866895 RepID=I0JI11_HALH3|nr:thiamine-phosphate kinase [Halobacillus halophilus]ASF37981.1 thiamine-monophosphate kinase [Halobacillus halophilus]CCG43779.1 thiamine monophosphate kinase [Halobacillus halophilus DSM 2266]